MASEEEINLLVIVVDVNPIWWGQQAQREPEFTLSKCMDAVMVMGNAHTAMNRTNKLAVIASHCQDSLSANSSQSGHLDGFLLLCSETFRFLSGKLLQSEETLMGQPSASSIKVLLGVSSD